MKFGKSLAFQLVICTKCVYILLFEQTLCLADRQIDDNRIFIKSNDKIDYRF